MRAPRAIIFFAHARIYRSLAQALACAFIARSLSVRAQDILAE